MSTLPSTTQPQTVQLRAIEPEDLDLLYEIENDQSLWHVGVTNVPYSRYTLHDYIATSSDDIYTDRQVRLIIDDADGNTVGVADLVNFNPQHLRAEAGIVIQQPFRRRGLALATLDALADYALRILHLNQLYAVIAADNSAAISLFRKAGYEQTAVLQKWLCTGHFYQDAVVLQKKL